MHVTKHAVQVSAPAKVVYDLIADAQRWPYRFGPTVHVRQEHATESEELLRLWALANGTVRTWTSHRVLDPVDLRVRFQQVQSAAPVASMGGEWIVSPHDEHTSTVELLHDFRAIDDDAQALRLIDAAVGRNSTVELAALKRAAELGDQLAQLELSFDDTLHIDAPAAAVYDFLNRAERWPALLPHVSRLELTEDEPGQQVIVMDTRSPDGSVHTTKSVRVCFPHERIVFKQTATPPVMQAHIGRWELVETGGATEVTVHHTVVIRPEAITDVFGPDATVDTARTAIRTALGRNSLITLNCAKQALERP